MLQNKNRHAPQEGLKGGVWSRLTSLRPSDLSTKKLTPILGILLFAAVGSYLLLQSFAATPPVPVTAVTASSHDGNVPTNTVDKKLSTRWSASGDGQWIRFDLGSQKRVDHVKIAFYQGNQRTSRFDIQVSSNGTSWTNLLTSVRSRGKSTRLETFNVPDTSARYVRYLGHGNSKSAWNSLTEVEIYDTGGSTTPSPQPPAPQPPSPQPPTSSADSPADILDLSNWKLTLPTGPSTSATEVKQPQLAAFSTSPWFTLNANRDAVIFRAPIACKTTTGPACGSRTSTNTSYARSELREMTNNGTANAAWSMTSGTHTMEVNLAFTKLPSGKPHLVGAQIHDGSDDITVIRLEEKSLWVTQGDNTHHKLITNNYTLGTRATIKFVASGGKVQVYYNGSLQTTISTNATGNYFKTGAYTQANCDNASPCDGNVNYGEVHVYSAKVTHQ